VFVGDRDRQVDRSLRVGGREHRRDVFVRPSVLQVVREHVGELERWVGSTPVRSASNW
jgi:hypothetical protein